MDLFLGMDYDDNYSYTGSDSLLYRFPGLIMVENDAIWYDGEEYEADDAFYMKFRFSMGLYIDKEYPSEAIFRKMEGAIDSALVFGMEPYGGMDNKPAFRLRESHKPQNAANPNLLMNRFLRDGGALWLTRSMTRVIKPPIWSL